MARDSIFEVLQYFCLKYTNISGELMHQFFTCCHLFQEAVCGYAIIIMAVFWITEALPIAVTALLPVFLFPIIGLSSVKATSQQYINVRSHFVSIKRWIFLIRMTGKQPFCLTSTSDQIKLVVKWLRPNGLSVCSDVEKIC